LCASIDTSLVRAIQKELLLSSVIMESKTVFPTEVAPFVDALMVPTSSFPGGILGRGVWGGEHSGPKVEIIVGLATLDCQKCQLAVGIHECPWKSMYVHGCASNGYPWTSMDA